VKNYSGNIFSTFTNVFFLFVGERFFIYASHSNLTRLQWKRHDRATEWLNNLIWRVMECILRSVWWLRVHAGSWMGDTWW